MNGRFVGLVSVAAALAAGCCSQVGTPGARPLKVVMLGNSFGECIMHYTPEFAAACGAPLDLCSLFIGGCSLGRHAENAARTEADFAPYRVMWQYASLADQTRVPFYGLLTRTGEHPMAECPRHIGHANWPAVLKAEKWDVVVIHQRSEDSWQWKTYQPDADRVIAKIRELAPQARIVVQETWSYCDLSDRVCDPKTGGPGTYGVDKRGMYERLHDCYGRLAAANGFAVIPTGTAIQRYRDALPVGKDVLADDLVGNDWPDGKGGRRIDFKHLNRRGEYLQAATWTAALTGRDVRDVGFLPPTTGLSRDRAALIRACAQDAVDGLHK